MDEHSQIRPERDDYAADVERIADAIQNGSVVHVALTYRLTRQSLVIALASHYRLTESPVERFSTIGGVPHGSPFLFVARPERGAYWFNVDYDQTPAYVAQKLGVLLADAEAIADLLNRVGARLTGRDAPAATLAGQ